VIVVLLTPILAAKLLFNATSYSAEDPVNEPYAQNSMEFVTWNGEKWTSWIRDDRFEHRPENEAKWGQHSTGSVAFVGWDGVQWQAKIDGDEFLLAHHGDWLGHTEHAGAVRYLDWQGKNQIRTVTQLTR